MENNLIAIRILGGSPGPLKVAVTDSTLVGNSSGIVNSSTAGPSQVTLKKVVVANNSVVGISNIGFAASTLIGDSVVTGNATGVANSGGIFTSYKNNQIRLNTVDGTPLPAETSE